MRHPVLSIAFGAWALLGALSAPAQVPAAPDAAVPKRAPSYVDIAGHRISVSFEGVVNSMPIWPTCPDGNPTPEVYLIAAVHSTPESELARKLVFTRLWIVAGSRSWTTDLADHVLLRPTNRPPYSDSMYRFGDFECVMASSMLAMKDVGILQFTYGKKSYLVRGVFDMVTRAN